MGSCRRKFILVGLALTPAMAAPRAADACTFAPDPAIPEITEVAEHPTAGPRALVITARSGTAGDMTAEVLVGDWQVANIVLGRLGAPGPVRTGAATHRGVFALTVLDWESLPRPVTVQITPIAMLGGDPMRGEMVTLTFRDDVAPIHAANADQLLFALFAMSLFGVILLYRREACALQRIRLLGASGLIAVLFLCTVPAMPWTEGAAQSDTPELCSLGAEVPCVAEQAAFAGISGTELEATLDRVGWASAGIRAGLVTLIVLLLPACIWLIAAPRNRGAQALVLGGLIPAIFTAGGSIAYMAILGSPTVRTGGAPDLTLAAASAIIAVAVIAGLSGRRLRSAANLPTARAREA